MSKSLLAEDHAGFERLCLSVPRAQAAALVETCLLLEDRDDVLSGGGDLSSEVRRHMAPGLHYLRRVCHTYAGSIPATRWARELSPVGPVVAAGLAVEFAGTDLPSVDQMLRRCGLHPNAVHLNEVEASRLYARVCRAMPTITWPEARALAAATGRNAPAAWSDASAISRADVIDWLCEPPCPPLLHSLMQRIGQALARQRDRFDNRFSRLYWERLAAEAHRNETGVYAERARQALRRKRDEADPDLLQGRLPRAQLAAFAQRWVLRQFITELHRRFLHAGEARSA